MKRILGEKTPTKNCLIYAETGCYPLDNIIYKRIITQWLKLMMPLEHRYTYIIYSKSNSSSWSLFVRIPLYKNGFGMSGTRMLSIRFRKWQ